jgi:gas vesicle protein
MSRFTLGAALGGAAVYFFDPSQGEDRRRRVQSLWRENREAAYQVGAGVSQATESMRPLVRRMRRGLEQRDWVETAGASWMPAVIGIFVASAVGGALVYFLDPQNGLGRRNSVLTHLGEGQGALKQGMRSVRKAAGTVGPRAKQAVSDVSRVAEEVMAIGRG